eukprot:scaffold156046_cov29-Tisochrysis_lutea.AAC.4
MYVPLARRAASEVASVKPTAVGYRASSYRIPCVCASRAISMGSSPVEFVDPSSTSSHSADGNSPAHANRARTHSAWSLARNRSALSTHATAWWGLAAATVARCVRHNLHHPGRRCGGKARVPGDRWWAHAQRGFPVRLAHPLRHTDQMWRLVAFEAIKSATSSAYCSSKSQTTVLLLNVALPSHPCLSALTTSKPSAIAAFSAAWPSKSEAK